MIKGQAKVDLCVQHFREKSPMQILSTSCSIATILCLPKNEKKNNGFIAKHNVHIRQHYDLIFAFNCGLPYIHCIQTIWMIQITVGWYKLQNGKPGKWNEGKVLKTFFLYHNCSTFILSNKFRNVIVCWTADFNM